MSRRHRRALLYFAGSLLCVAIAVTGLYTWHSWWVWAVSVVAAMAVSAALVTGHY